MLVNYYFLSYHDAMGRQLRSNMRRLAKGLEEREQWEKGLDACSTFELWMLVFFSFGGAIAIFCWLYF